jgi:4-alpha-glucanotransferase
MITIHFYLRYRSVYGQSFFVSGNIEGLGNGNTGKALPIQYLNDEYWHGSLEVPENTGDIKYSYLLRNQDGFESIEAGNDRVINTRELSTKELQVIDTWNYAGEFENAFFTQPFTETLLKKTGAAPTLDNGKSYTHIFRIKAPLLAADESICLVGSCPVLGDWKTEAPILLAKDGHWYSAKADLGNTHFPVVYKYGVWNNATNSFSRFETGANRTLHGTGNHEITLLHDGFIGLPNTSFKGAGVAIPVFSLRTANSFGVGEFADIKTLVDWGKQVGLKLIQLLPLNDTTATHTWVDSYPYSAISAFALHPMFINLEKLAGDKYKAAIADLKPEQARLNNLPEVDYEAVNEAKWGAMKKLYTLMKKEWLANKDYQQFYQQHQHWLLPYAAFCYLRDKYQTSDFSKWDSFNVYDAKAVEKLVAPKSKTFDEVALHLFIQYQLHLQLKEAVDYAHANGLIMKGDIPIGIYRNSADAWVEPGLYNMDAQAGAPPDDFAVKGQNWGFPTYNWKRMQEDGFTWWKKRFEQMSLYFDAFRIDHILGFFRIWSIPMHAVQGIMGRFVPCIPVYPHEFADRGIWFDYNRYCKPFINEHVLAELFGDTTHFIKDTFVNDLGWGNFALKPEFDTQRKVEEWFEQNPGNAEWIQNRLFDLISNVILFDDTQNAIEISRGYHFRIAMDETISFRYLDEHTKQQLKDLYVNYFFRRQNDYWRNEAMHKLPALKASTNMLICGEDLGMVPECVPGVMKDLGLLSLEIQRMPKDPTKKFFHPKDAPYMSVVTPSTHDMSTVRDWWEEDRAATQQFFNQELGQWGTAPFYCEPWVSEAIINQHVYSPAMWSIFQLQDLLGMDGKLRRQIPEDERINVPANPKHYWRYRMHMNLETLAKEEGFNGKLKDLLKKSGRI